MIPASDRLLRLLRSLSPVEAENRLMRVSDREIALSMRFLSQCDRAYLFSLVAAPKRRRIQDELALHKRLVIRPDQYQRTIDHLVELLGQERYSGSIRSYLRPLRDGRRKR